MVKPPFVWLGSRRAKKRDVGNKGIWLDEAARAGLPVPAGGILLDELYHFLLEERVITLSTDLVTVPDPEFLHDTLFNAVRFPRMKSLIALRATASLDTSSPTDSGNPYPPRLSVDPNDPAQLASALSEVWTALLLDEQHHSLDSVTFRRDVLVMEMVQVQQRGDAFTISGTKQDRVEHFIDEGPVTLRLQKLRGWHSPDKSLPPFAQRLQRLLRGVRRTFGETGWQIEWLDDGRICWISQIVKY